MFGYGSKLGGTVVVVFAAAAGLIAGISSMAFAPHRAVWALYLSSSLIALTLLGRALMRPRQPIPVTQPLPTSAVLESGQFVPWDAVILAGESEVDEGALGGSVFAAWKSTGDRLRQGTRNGDGRLQIAPRGTPAPSAPPPGLEAIFPDTLNRQSGRILLGLLVLATAVAIRIDAITAIFVVAAAVPPSLGLIRAVIFRAAQGKARKLGMDLRDAAAIDVLAKTETVALAPGGILTRTDLSLLSLYPAPGFEPAEVIAAATTCCQSSRSGVARAILHYAVAHGVRLRSVTDWRSESGHGLIAMSDLGAELALGDREWLESHGLPSADFDAIALPVAAPGRRMIWIAELAPHMSLIGGLALGDLLKSGAAELAKNLQRIGIETILLDAGATEAQLDLARQLGLGRSLPDIAARQHLLLVDRSGATPILTGAGGWLRFGMAQAQADAGAVAGIRREDPRAILDLIRLARATRRRETMATLLAFAFCLPGLWFALAGRVGIEIAILSPLLGLGAIILSAQFLHLFLPTASEVDDE